MVDKRFTPRKLAEIRVAVSHNKSVRKVASELGVSKSTVQNYRTAVSQPVERAKPGRQSVTTPAHKKAIKAKALRSGIGSRKIGEWCVQRGYRKVSKGTILAVLKGGTSPLAYKPVKSGRVLSEKNRELRLKFVKQHMNVNFDRVIFMDQKEVSMGYDQSEGYSKRWQREDNNVEFKKSTQPQKFMFYAAVAKGHKSALVRVPLGGKGKGRGTAGFDSNMFIKVFKQLWLEVKRWYPEGQQFWVVMDSAKQHVSKVAKSRMAARGVPLLTGFPPQSYDMNLIEVAWGHLQQQLQGRRFQRKDNYEKEIREAWGRVKQSTIDKLVANHKQQLQKIKEAGGNWVNY